jgi:hypothetical protein
MPAVKSFIFSCLLILFTVDIKGAQVFQKPRSHFAFEVTLSKFQTEESQIFGANVNGQGDLAPGIGAYLVYITTLLETCTN